MIPPQITELTHESHFFTIPMSCSRLSLRSGQKRCQGSVAWAAETEDEAAEAEDEAAEAEDEATEAEEAAFPKRMPRMASTLQIV